MYEVRENRDKFYDTVKATTSLLSRLRIVSRGMKILMHRDLLFI